MQSSAVVGLHCSSGAYADHKSRDHGTASLDQMTGPSAYRRRTHVWPAAALTVLSHLYPTARRDSQIGKLFDFYYTLERVLLSGRGPVRHFSSETIWSASYSQLCAEPCTRSRLALLAEGSRRLAPYSPSTSSSPPFVLLTRVPCLDRLSETTLLMITANTKQIIMMRTIPDPRSLPSPPVPAEPPASCAAALRGTNHTQPGPYPALPRPLTTILPHTYCLSFPPDIATKLCKRQCTGAHRSCAALTTLAGRRGCRRC